MNRMALIAALMTLVAMSVPSVEASIEGQGPPKAKPAAGTTEKGTRMRYGMHGKLTAQPGKRQAVVDILLRDVEELKAAGCDLYMVSLASDHPDVIWVTEVWTSSEAHRASLQLPSVKKAIAEAMPMLTKEFGGSEFSVVGGLGVPAPSP
jgi:quinol monooxygenase YgiN